MNDIEKEFAKNAIKAFISKYAVESNDDYDFNPEKCDKMNAVIAYCQSLEEKYSCKIIRCMLEPKYIQGYVEVLFKGEASFSKDDGTLGELSKTFSMCDGVNISTNPASEEFFQITFFIDNLWVKKETSL